MGATPCFAGLLNLVSPSIFPLYPVTSLGQKPDQTELRLIGDFVPLSRINPIQKTTSVNVRRVALCGKCPLPSFRALRQRPENGFFGVRFTVCHPGLESGIKLDR